MDKGLEFFLWGLLGGIFIDGLDFVKLIRARGGKMLKRATSAGYMLVLGEVLRLLIGGALALVFYESNQVNTPLAAATIGMTAPMIIERLGREPPKVK